ncbi:IS110 family transposase [Mesorhizobium sp. WSM4906]|uniref:IS110 family transposase n=1 Tax=Mesorhizobium sp. WSM4906 TaxID=3038546 RepID=UPI00241679F3|nr:IS110 family transposase [Mesorhizobium sp. WSM4906]WFP74782.1 IS110 family transposase [Mesorhizobium sp. WSM4906]WFP74834.1 IS110 family transposase [Mesorhizobium sp. WSM4906]WFP77037.1 IS110 family transposase [Mesorhizobium sp. WSM4906]
MCLGFDIAKDTITVCDGATTRTIANQRRTIRALLKSYKHIDLVVCEPTGGHESLLLEECLRAGIACHRADTLKVKSFIRSYGTHGKSDAIDAGMLWAYGRERWDKLCLWQAPDAEEIRLRALVRRRQELIALRGAEKNRLKAPGGRELAASFKALIKAIDNQIKAIEADIRELVANSTTLKHRAAICTAMDSLGPIVAAKLLATLPELGSMTRRKAAALAGLAPHPNDSGQKHGYRKIRGGRPEVRSMLYMPALHAAAGRGEFAPFYKRLRANGKKPMVAIAAVMRKIIVTLNARLRDASILQS